MFASEIDAHLKKEAAISPAGMLKVPTGERSGGN
jgi:hypothetical protein